MGWQPKVGYWQYSTSSYPRLKLARPSWNLSSNMHYLGACLYSGGNDELGNSMKNFAWKSKELRFLKKIFVKAPMISTSFDLHLRLI